MFVCFLVCVKNARSGKRKSFIFKFNVFSQKIQKILAIGSIDNYSSIFRVMAIALEEAAVPVSSSLPVLLLFGVRPSTDEELGGFLGLRRYILNAKKPPTHTQTAQDTTGKRPPLQINIQSFSW
jgi:hypothetical protein